MIHCNKCIQNYNLVCVIDSLKGAVVKQLVCDIFNLKVSCSSPVSACCHVVSLDKKLFSTLSYSAQVYKWVSANLTVCDEVERLQLICIFLSRGWEGERVVILLQKPGLVKLSVAVVGHLD